MSHVLISAPSDCNGTSVKNVTSAHEAGTSPNLECQLTGKQGPFRASPVPFFGRNDDTDDPIHNVDAIIFLGTSSPAPPIIVASEHRCIPSSAAAKCLACLQQMDYEVLTAGFVKVGVVSPARIRVIGKLLPKNKTYRFDTNCTEDNCLGVSSARSHTREYAREYRF